MKIVVEIPLRETREYLDDFDEESIPNVGDRFDEHYIVKWKQIQSNICTLIVEKARDDRGI